MSGLPILVVDFTAFILEYIKCSAERTCAAGTRIVMLSCILVIPIFFGDCIRPRVPQMGGAEQHGMDAQFQS